MRAKAKEILIQTKNGKYKKYYHLQPNEKNSLKWVKEKNSGSCLWVTENIIVKGTEKTCSHWVIDGSLIGSKKYSEDIPRITFGREDVWNIIAVYDYQDNSIKIVRGTKKLKII